MISDTFSRSNFFMMNALIGKKMSVFEVFFSRNGIVIQKVKYMAIFSNQISWFSAMDC